MSFASPPNSSLVGAVDQGTSSTRFLIFDSIRSELITYHQVPITQIFPREGWVEEDPKEILSSVKACINKAVENLKGLDIDPSALKAIGITNQRETLIVWDKLTGEPLYNAIVWLDTRTIDTVDQLIEKCHNKDFLRRKCGLPLSTYFSAVKMKWLLDNVPKVVEAVNDGRCLFGNVDSWLVWNLTGGVNGGCHVTDVTNASRTMLMDLHTLQWDKTLCRFFDVPEHILPEIRSSSEVYGHLSETSIKGTPISGILGDQQAALVGQACLKSGYGKNTYGTGCFLLYNTGGVPVISEHGLLTTVAYQLGKNKPVHYALEGSIAIAGAAVQWLRDNIGIISTSADIETLAKTVDTSHGCYFVPAFSGLFCPYWHTDARGLICGLTQFTTKAHIARATLEAVCFQTREILEAMKQDSNIEMQSLQVDGGMTANELLMQLQADLIGIPVVRPSMPETTALGAAIAAGQAEGIDVWNQDNLTAITTDTFLPTVTEEERDKRFSHWKEAVKRCMHWKASGVISNADTTVDAKWTTFPGCMFLLLSAATWIGAELLANAKE